MRCQPGAISTKTTLAASSACLISLGKDLARVDAALVIKQRLAIEPQPQPVPQSPGVPLGIGTAVGEEDGRHWQAILLF